MLFGDGFAAPARRARSVAEGFGEQVDKSRNPPTFWLEDKSKGRFNSRILQREMRTSRGISTDSQHDERHF